MQCRSVAISSRPDSWLQTTDKSRVPCTLAMPFSSLFRPLFPPPAAFSCTAVFLVVLDVRLPAGAGGETALHYTLIGWHERNKHEHGR